MTAQMPGPLKRITNDKCSWSCVARLPDCDSVYLSVYALGGETLSLSLPKETTGKKVPMNPNAYTMCASPAVRRRDRKLASAFPFPQS